MKVKCERFGMGQGWEWLHSRGTNESAEPHSHLTTNTDRLVEGVHKLLLAEMRDRLAEELVGETGVVPQTSDRVGDVGVAETLRSARRHYHEKRTHRAIRTPLPELMLRRVSG
jgi:hypothetical protein